MTNQVLCHFRENSAPSSITDEADPSWHREVVQVLGLDMKCQQPLDWQPAIVQVFVLKQMAVSASGKNADLRYNNHSPDFDETQHMQNEKY